MIGVYATCRVKAEEHSAFEALVQRFIQESRQHQGCVSYDAGWENLSEGTFCFMERWQTQEDLNKHLDSPFFRENAPILSTMLENELQIHTLTLL